MEDENLHALARCAWDLHKAAEGKPWLVTPSAPVLFFGNLYNYKSSPIRIATVALNPSRQEFPAQSPFCRFPGAETADIRAYLVSLSKYFQNAPYRAWFDFYDQALSGLNASYYGQTPNTALHTDIGSVLPTNPTWSGLDNDVRKEIASCGVPLWHRLISYLEPQILLLSTARAWLDLINLTPTSPWHVLCAFCETQSGSSRKRPISVCGRWYQLQTGAPVLIAFIPAAQKPLAPLSHPQKAAAGKAILRNWRALNGRSHIRTISAPR